MTERIPELDQWQAKWEAESASIWISPFAMADLDATVAALVAKEREEIIDILRALPGMVVHFGVTGAIYRDDAIAAIRARMP